MCGDSISGCPMHNHNRSWIAGKPKKKPEYNPDAVTEELVQAVVNIYEMTDEEGRHPALSEIVDTLDSYHLNPMKVRRILITAESCAGYPIYEGTEKCERRIEEIEKLRRMGKSFDEIAKELEISKATVLSYSPYSKIIYKMDVLPGGEKSVDADRQELYRRRKISYEMLAADPCAENLWKTVAAFEGYPLKTSSGLDFTYEFKKNRHGEKGNEIVVSRKEKTITRSSIEIAFRKVIDRNEPLPVAMSSPKELGVFGASYIYGLFIRLRLVRHTGKSSACCNENK